MSAKTAYVVMIGDSPTAVAPTLDSAQAEARRQETRLSRPEVELRWDQYNSTTWRLMSRDEGRRRFAWTLRSVHVVPTIETGGAR